MYADIHCYPGKVAYDSQVMAVDGRDVEPLDPWQIPQSDLNAQANASYAAAYSQCDFAKSTQARVKLMFAALYPIEKGFFHGISESKINKQAMSEYYTRVHFNGESSALKWLMTQLMTIEELNSLKKTDFTFLQNRFTRLPLQRIMFLQNGDYDYFEELKREYKFYLSKSGEKANTNKIILEPGGPQRKWEGVYQLAKNGNDVLHRLRPDNDDVVIVLTLEGIHSLGIGNPEDEYLKEGDARKDVSIGRLKSRIRQIKGEEPLEDSTLKRWEHCPFSITFSKHFNNTLCGHARSFPAISQFVYDQKKNLNKGILRNVAYGVMQELLGLDENLYSTGSKRILIDVKNMSAAARKDFYKNIIRPYNRRPENLFSKIPVIASHVGYSGIDSLDALITNVSDGKETDSFYVKNFKAWNINLCDEDVIEVHHSGGLIGITLDQQLLGLPQGSNLFNLKLSSLEKRRARTLLARTLQEFVRIPFDYNLPDAMKIWDMLCIGTGFDGTNDPLNGYSTVLEMNKLEDDLIDILSKIRREQPKWFGKNSPENLARKICFENAYDFVLTHYRS